MKYVSRYNVDFELPNGYTEGVVDKSNFKNSIANFNSESAPNFAFLFEGTTVANTNAYFFGFIKNKYNSNQFNLIASNEITFKLPIGEQEVLETAIHNKELNKNFIAYFFKYDNRYNYVGGFAFEHKNGTPTDVYRNILKDIFKTKQNELDYVEVVRDPNVRY